MGIATTIGIKINDLQIMHCVRDAGVAGYGDRRIAIVRLDSFDFLTHGMAENLMPAPTQFGSSSLAIVEQFYRFPWPWQ